jgi:hypothetical protein
MFHKRLLLVFALLALVFMALPITFVSPIAVQAVRAADPIAVYGAYATPLEEPWPNVIHQALLGAQKKG